MNPVGGRRVFSPSTTRTTKFARLAHACVGLALALVVCVVAASPAAALKPIVVSPDKDYIERVVKKP